MDVKQEEMAISVLQEEMVICVLHRSHKLMYVNIYNYVEKSQYYCSHM